MGQCPTCVHKDRQSSDWHDEAKAVHDDAVHLSVSTPTADFSTLRQLSRTWSQNFAMDGARWMFGDYFIPHSGNWSSMKTISEVIDELKALGERAAQRPVIIQLDYGATKTFPSASNAVMLVAEWSQEAHVVERTSNVSWAWGNSSAPFRWSSAKPLLDVIEEFKSVNIERPVIVRGDNGAQVCFQNMADAVSGLSKPVKRSPSTQSVFRVSLPVTDEVLNPEAQQQEHPLKYSESRITWAWGDLAAAFQYTSLWWGIQQSPEEVVKELQSLEGEAANRPIVMRAGTDSNREKIFENAKAAIAALLQWKESSARYFWMKSPPLLDKLPSLNENVEYCCAQDNAGAFEKSTEKGVSEFSGIWQVDPGATEGFESILEASEVSYFLRKAALTLAAAGTFIPKMEITSDGEKFLVVVTGVNGPETMEFIVGGPSFSSTFGPQKLAGVGKAVWDGPVLVLDVQMDGQRTETSRWIEGGMLKDKTTLTKGARVGVMKRTWKRIS